MFLDPVQMGKKRVGSKDVENNFGNVDGYGIEDDSSPTVYVLRKFCAPIWFVSRKPVPVVEPGRTHLLVGGGRYCNEL
jgi:hypothetical protein